MCIAAILSHSLQNREKSYGAMEEKTNSEAPNGNTENSETFVAEQEDLMITHVSPNANSKILLTLSVWK